MNVHDIVKQYLKDNGFDGLCTEDCGCLIDDLFPCCQEGLVDCVPGYKLDAEDAVNRGYNVNSFPHDSNYVVVENKEVE